MHVLSLVQQKHGAKVSDTLVSELRAGDELQALELTEMRRVAEHVDIEELRDVPTPPHRVLLAEGGSDVGTLAVDHGSLFGLCLGGTDLSDQVAKSSWGRHPHCKRESDS